jgi:nucleoside-triphosphatase THEP1
MGSGEHRKGGSGIWRAAAIVLPVHGSAQDILSQFAEELRGLGKTVGGLIQRGLKEEAELVALDTGESFPLMQKLGNSACCAIDNQEMASACMVVRRAVEHACDLVIVNKFGHMEIDGDGLADEMMAAMAAGLPLLTTVTENRAAAWQSFTGGMTQLLPPDLEAVRHWWRSL